MDYEKAYKDALERAREELGSGCFDRGTVEYIFPELKESDDERIRKKLLNWFKDCHWDSIDDETLKRDDIIAWLEKQNDVKFPKVPIEHGKYYYCIKDYYSGGNLRAKRGDVVQALRGMSMMILDSMEAGKYFLPVNKIEKQGEQKPTTI